MMLMMPQMTQPKTRQMMPLETPLETPLELLSLLPFVELLDLLDMVLQKYFLSMCPLLLMQTANK
jgi:hypothetical protein